MKTYSTKRTFSFIHTMLEGIYPLVRIDLHCDYSYTHAFIHNWLLQSFSQDYGLTFHTHIVCVNFIMEWRGLQFNVSSERLNFWEVFRGMFIYSQSFSQKTVERMSPKKYFFIFSFQCLTWDMNLGFYVY